MTGLTGKVQLNTPTTTIPPPLRKNSKKTCLIRRVDGNGKRRNVDEEQQAVQACSHTNHHKVHQDSPFPLVHRAQVERIERVLPERTHELFHTIGCTWEQHCKRNSSCIQQVYIAQGIQQVFNRFMCPAVSNRGDIKRFEF